MTNMIDIAGLSLDLGGTQILKEISLSVEAGEYVSIVGPNGAGKTTLLKCLSRFFHVPRNCIQIAGKPLEKYHQKDLAKVVGYVPQADGWTAPFTVHEFVLMGRYPYLSPFTPPGEEDREAVRQALEETGMLAFSDRALHTLSGGERQTVSIAAAFAQGADILLLDEPATFLDPKHKSDVYALLARANQDRGITVISVTHDINDAVSTSRRIVALKAGEVAYCGDPAGFMHNEVLQEVYGKSFLFGKHPVTNLPIVVPEVL